MLDDDFLDRTPLRTLLDLPSGLIDQAKALAYRCHLAGHHEQAEALCRGLLALDHRCWWTRALCAATLRQTGRLVEALALVDEGLHHDPDQPTLTALAGELAAVLLPEAA